jgi:hypothetical protein
MRDGVPDREKCMIQSPKLTVMFVWNPHGFQVVDAIPKGEMFTGTYSIQNILIEIVARREMERDERR